MGMDLFAHTTQAPPRRLGAGLWAVVFAFMAAMAFSTVPTPLYTLYQARDGFSTFIVTVIFAAYAAGVIVALFAAGHVSDWLGRRRALVPAVLLSAVSAIVFLTWRELPGLLVGRVLSGLSVGVVTATATAYLAELHLRARRGASPARAQLLATTANLGGLGLGPLLAGLLAQSVGAPLTVPFVLFLVLLTAAAVAVALAPETVSRPSPRPAYRPQRVAVPAEARGRFFGAAAGGVVAFAAFGLFTSLAPTFLAVTLGRTSHALAGVPAFTRLHRRGRRAARRAGVEMRRVLTTGTAGCPRSPPRRRRDLACEPGGVPRRRGRRGCGCGAALQGRRRHGVAPRGARAPRRGAGRLLPGGLRRHLRAGARARRARPVRRAEGRPARLRGSPLAALAAAARSLLAGPPGRARTLASATRPDVTGR